MSEKTEKMPDASEESAGVNEQNASQQGDSQEPKNVQELTNYIQSMLQQMQDRFQTISDQVNIDVGCDLPSFFLHYSSCNRN